MGVLAAGLLVGSRSPGRAAPCIKANLYSSGWLWLSSRLEGAVKEELKWKSPVDKGCLPSEELNSILFLLGFECRKEQIRVCGVLCPSGRSPGVRGLWRADRPISAFAPTLKSP